VGTLARQAKVFSDHLGERTGHLLSYSWSGHAHHDGGRIKIMFCLVIFDKFTDHPRRMGDGAPSSGDSLLARASGPGGCFNECEHRPLFASTGPPS
jgi:hypothetical protein